MTTCNRSSAAVRWLPMALGCAAGAYAAYAAVTWYRYGRPQLPASGEADPLLDGVMPLYDVVERHAIAVDAPAAVTLDAARRLQLTSIPIVRAIFKGREVILGATPGQSDLPRGLLDEMHSLGWAVLAETPDRELVVGAVTKPWQANPVFRPVPPAEFAAFNEPDYVKIAWTLRADPTGEGTSIFRTETRALATDASARTKFRRYWAFLSPGIILIRWLTLAPVKAAAERAFAQSTVGA